MKPELTEAFDLDAHVSCTCQKNMCFMATLFPTAVLSLSAALRLLSYRFPPMNTLTIYVGYASPLNPSPVEYTQEHH
jgi:hypothetical protein